MTLTTEQLRARAAAIRCEALSKADQGFAFQSQRLYETAAALDELAANREAQSVGKVKSFSLGCFGELLRPLPEGTPLYAAPPAPAVVKLPTEFYSDEGIVVRLEEVMAALAVVGVKYERKANAKTRCECPESEVPEEMTGGIAMSEYKVKKSNYVQWVKGFNACRAAMLAAAPEGGN
ncbi:TPA: hypothetical protein ACKPVT_001901 [Serratia marcescens]